MRARFTLTSFTAANAAVASMQALGATLFDISLTPGESGCCAPRKRIVERPREPPCTRFDRSRVSRSGYLARIQHRCRSGRALLGTGNAREQRTYGGRRIDREPLIMHRLPVGAGSALLVPTTGMATARAGCSRSWVAAAIAAFSSRATSRPFSRSSTM